MIKPALALAALVTVLAVPARPVQAQEAGICQSGVVGCSSGSQLCATLEMSVDIDGVKVGITKYCYEPA